MEKGEEKTLYEKIQNSGFSTEDLEKINNFISSFGRSIDEIIITDPKKGNSIILKNNKNEKENH